MKIFYSQNTMLKVVFAKNERGIGLRRKIFDGDCYYKPYFYLLRL